MRRLQINKFLMLSLLLGAALLALYFYKFNTYKSQLLIYPTNQIDSIKISRVINSTYFLNEFSEYLTNKSQSVNNFNIRATAAISGLINISIYCDDNVSLPLLTSELKTYLEDYIKNNRLFSSNSEIKLFIIQDIVSSTENEINSLLTNADQTPSIDEFGENGILLKNLLHSQALLFVDSRLNNIDTNVILNEFKEIKYLIAKSLQSSNSDNEGERNIDATKNTNLENAMKISYLKSVVKIAKEREYDIKISFYNKFQIIIHNKIENRFSLFDMSAALFIIIITFVAMFLFVDFYLNRDQSKNING